MLLLSLFACGGSPSGPATEPDNDATEAIVKALCDLAKGAGHACSPRTRQIALDKDKLVTVEAFIDEADDTLGQITIHGRARLTYNGQSLTSRFDLSGFGENEAYKRGVHLWAVLTGTPMIDWILGDPARPALTALYRDSKTWTQPASAPVGGFTALEGWTLLQGVHKDLEHSEIVPLFAPVVQGFDAAKPHIIELKAASDLGKQVFTCHVNGEPAERLCDTISSGPWPKGVGWELRQTYVLVPKDTFPPQLNEASPPPNDG